MSRQSPREGADMKNRRKSGQTMVEYIIIVVIIAIAIVATVIAIVVIVIIVVDVIVIVVVIIVIVVVVVIVVVAAIVFITVATVITVAVVTLVMSSAVLYSARHTLIVYGGHGGHFLGAICCLYVTHKTSWQYCTMPCRQALMLHLLLHAQSNMVISGEESVH